MSDSPMTLEELGVDVCLDEKKWFFRKYFVAPAEFNMDWVRMQESVVLSDDKTLYYYIDSEGYQRYLCLLDQSDCKDSSGENIGRQIITYFGVDNSILRIKTDYGFTEAQHQNLDLVGKYGCEDCVYQNNLLVQKKIDIFGGYKYIWYNPDGSEIATIIVGNSPRSISIKSVPLK